MKKGKAQNIYNGINVDFEVLETGGVKVTYSDLESLKREFGEDDVGDLFNASEVYTLINFKKYYYIQNIL